MFLISADESTPPPAKKQRKTNSPPSDSELMDIASPSSQMNVEQSPTNHIESSTSDQIEDNDSIQSKVIGDLKTSDSPQSILTEKDAEEKTLRNIQYHLAEIIQLLDDLQNFQGNTSKVNEKNNIMETDPCTSYKNNTSNEDTNTENDELVQSKSEEHGSTAGKEDFAANDDMKFVET